MQETASSGEQSQRLDALDPGLPFLASEAAIELDNILLSRGIRLTAVKHLAKRLENATEQVAGSDARTSLMDPATVTVFSSAIAASGIPNVRTLSDLASEAWQIARDLQESKDRSNVERIEKLRSFCKSLAQSAVAHERSLYDRQSINKHWS